jgi:hypothetical protein
MRGQSGVPTAHRRGWFCHRPGHAPDGRAVLTPRPLRSGGRGRQCRPLCPLGKRAPKGDHRLGAVQSWSSPLSRPTGSTCRRSSAAPAAPRRRQDGSAGGRSGSTVEPGGPLRFFFPATCTSSPHSFLVLMQHHDHVGALLQRAGITQIGKLGVLESRPCRRRRRLGSPSWSSPGPDRPQPNPAHGQGRGAPKDRAAPRDSLFSS